jgi:hypothetical protein
MGTFSYEKMRVQNRMAARTPRRTLHKAPLPIGHAEFMKELATYTPEEKRKCLEFVREALAQLTADAAAPVSP